MFHTIFIWSKDNTFACFSSLFAHFSDIGKIAEEFWQEKGPYTPESRSETYEFLRLQKEQESKKTTSYEWAKYAFVCSLNNIEVNTFAKFTF